MKVTNKNKNNYKIFRVEKDTSSINGYKKITMKKFYAKNDVEAYEYLKEYRKLANKQFIYYYGAIHTYKLQDTDGIVFECEYFSDAYKQEHDYKMKHYKGFKLVKYVLGNIWLDIQIWFEHYTVNVWHNITNWFSCMWYFHKHQQYKHASYGLDSYMLDTLMHNVRKLLENKHGVAYPYLDKARIELHKNEKDFDIIKYNKEHYDYTDDETTLASKYQSESYEQLLQYIRLYRYYLDDYMLIDSNDKELVELDKKYRHTLPIKPGTYDEMEYDKLSKLSDKYWNKIWEWMRMYGQTLWD